MKVRMQSVVAIALAVVTSMSMFGCAPKQPAGDTPKVETAQEATPKADDTKKEEPAAEPKEEAKAPDAKEASTGELHPMRYLTPGNMPTDAENVMKMVNDKIKADGGDIEVSLIRIPWDVYDQKLNAMIASGDEFEMMHVMQDVKNITSLVNMEAIAPIDDVLPNYPNLKAKFTDLEWTSSLHAGKHYAVPARWQDFSRAYGYMNSRANAMKAVTPEAPKTAEELLDVMKKMQPQIEQEIGKKPYTWLHQVGFPPAYLHRTYDTWPFYVDLSLSLCLVRQDGTVDSYFESEEFKKDAAYYKTLFDDGLINPDVLNVDSAVKYDEFKIGAALPSATFGYGDQVGLQENIPDETVQQFFLAPEKKKLVYTLSQNLNAMSATAEDVESGLKFLDWLYADKANHDLFFYGKEGVHYTASAPNRFESIKGADNNALYSFDTWMMGYLPYMRFNEKYPEKGIIDNTTSLPDSELVISPAAAFLFDASNVQQELVNLQTEIKASMYPIKYGLVSYEEGYETAIKRMKDAGLDKYVEEYRSQLAAFLAQSK